MNESKNGKNVILVLYLKSDVLMKAHRYHYIFLLQIKC